MKMPEPVAKIFVVDGKMMGSTVEEPLPTGTYYLYAEPLPPAQEFQTVSEEEAMKGGRWINADDVEKLVIELDVLINGREGRAKHPKLCDVVGQLQSMKLRPTPLAQDEPVAWIDRGNLDCVLKQGGGNGT